MLTGGDGGCSLERPDDLHGGSETEALHFIHAESTAFLCPSVIKIKGKPVENYASRICHTAMPSNILGDMPALGCKCQLTY